MTGHGQAAVERDQVRVVVEIRSVNNRFLKINISSDLDPATEAKIESLAKQHVHRGSVSIRVKTGLIDATRRYRLNRDAIQAYWLQLSEIAESSQVVNLESVLQLPGVVDESRDEPIDEDTIATVETATVEALQQLHAMRQIEGATMKTDMLENLQQIANQLVDVRDRAPVIAELYSQRLTERINQALSGHDASITPADIVKEVSLFADRHDLSEEVVRLESHVEQFGLVINGEPQSGKKLDFLVQEMLRETNTIGSKANDAAIARNVVEIKTAIERIREMVQNIE